MNRLDSGLRHWSRSKSQILRSAEQGWASLAYVVIQRLVFSCGVPSSIQAMLISHLTAFFPNGRVHLSTIGWLADNLKICTYGTTTYRGSFAIDRSTRSAEPKDRRRNFLLSSSFKPSACGDCVNSLWQLVVCPQPDILNYLIQFFKFVILISP